MSDPATPNLQPKDFHFKKRPPPPPQPIPRRLVGRVLTMMRLWRSGERIEAALRAEDLVARGDLDGRDLSAIASLGCVDCSLTAVRALGRRASAAAWKWRETRWLLPLLGHANERVRAQTLGAFARSATQLPADRLKRHVAAIVPQLRYLAFDPSPWVRAEALTLLGLIRDRTAHRLLEAATRDRYPFVRLAAAGAIARAVTLVKAAPTTARVCDLLSDPSPTVRAGVLELVAKVWIPCPLGAVAAGLMDPALAGQQLITDASGDQGQLGPRGPLRDFAWRALPEGFRAGSRPADSLAQRVELARAVLLRLEPALKERLAPRALLRPRAPQLARAWPPPAGFELAIKRFTTVLNDDALPAGEAIASLCRRREQQALIATVLPRLRSRRLLTFLTSCQVPLRGPLRDQVLGLLAHPDAELRLAALQRLGVAGLDDDRQALLTRALWLAREDPHPLVRRAALSRLVAWHRDRAVRDRVLGALGDPHPAVRLLAVALAFELAPALAAKRLAGRLQVEVPALRASLLAQALNDSAGPPPPKLVAPFLTDSESTRLRVVIGRREVLFENGYGTVRSTVVGVLEELFGMRHRGEELDRALRWQDQLVLRGYPKPIPTSPPRRR